jgi:hypothetical protein
MREMLNALWRVGDGAKSPDTDTTTTSTTTATSHDVYTADTAGHRACAWNERRADLGMKLIAHGTRGTENIWAPKREPSHNGFHLANVKYRSAGLSAMPTTLSSSSSSLSSAAALHLEALVHPALWTHPNPRRVVILTHENDDRADGALCEVLKHATVRQVQVVHWTKAIPLKEANINVPNDSFGTMNGPHRHETARMLHQQLYRDKQQKQFHRQTASNPSCRNDPRVAMIDHNDETPWVLPAIMDHSVDVVLVVDQLYVLAYVGNERRCFTL